MLFRWSRALFAFVQLFPSLGIISGTMDTLQFIYLTHQLNLLFYIVPISGLSWKYIKKPCELLPKKNSIDSLHTKFLKQLLGLQTQTHNIGVFLTTWRIPLMAFARKNCKISERYCSFCNSLEDEFHFLIDCPTYAPLRCDLFI